MNKCTVRIADWNWKNFALVRRVGSGCFGVFVISGLCVYDMRDAIVDPGRPLRRHDFSFRIPRLYFCAAARSRSTPCWTTAARLTL